MKISTFILVKSGNFCLKHSSARAWRIFLLKILIRRIKSIRKIAPFTEVGGPEPAPHSYEFTDVQGPIQAHNHKAN